MRTFICQQCGKVNEYTGKRKPLYCLKKLGQSISDCKQAWGRIHYARPKTERSPKRYKFVEEARPTGKLARNLARRKMREAMKKHRAMEEMWDMVELDANCL